MITSYLPAGQSLVLFTDLDGTLLDHHTYTAEGALEALQHLSEHRIPVVFCSSKTFAEQIYLQRQIGVCQPFILENGGGVAIPQGYFAIKNYTAVRQQEGYDVVALVEANTPLIREALRTFEEIKGFSTATDAELAAATGLQGEALGRARDRWFTETLLGCENVEALDRLKQSFLEKGWTLSRGGRFYTVTDAKADKGKAVQWLASVFREQGPTDVLLAATGDSMNDMPMLAVVDFPFLVQRPDGTWADMDVPGLTRIAGIGPVGFTAAVAQLLSSYTKPPK